MNISKELLAEVPARIIHHHTIFPLSKEQSKLRLASIPGFSRAKQEELRVILGREIECVPMAKEEIERLILKFYGVGAGVIESLVQDKKEEAADLDFETLDAGSSSEDATIRRLVNELLLNAIQLKASDIHIEPFQNHLRIRCRVDGLLQEMPVSDQIQSLASNLISRIKIMAHLDIGEKRLAQDGHIKIKYGDSEIDLRVSVLPSCFGEAVVIRILKSLSFLTLEELGFETDHLNRLRQQIRKPHGLILMTGPTGSGKTTTLYACLKEMNEVERKIITIEDPIEYKLAGIVQMQVNLKSGFTFPAALRSMLRHDPDCLMVGEIRDKETAEIAIKAAMTGHLVFSTLHTNDALSAIFRLLEMGIEPNLLASTLECVISQRLVRKVFGSGFRGRTVIYEMLLLDAELKERIAQKASPANLLSYASQTGFQDIHHLATLKASRGETTLGEIRRVI